MRKGAAPGQKTLDVARRLCAAAAIALPLALATAGAASAQAQAQAQMLLEADTLVYDENASTITARGNVRIDYEGSRLVAREVVFDRAQSRLIARGNVELVDSSGNVTTGDEVNLSDDMREGFANALRVETEDRTFFAAESAERRDGNVTIFNSGVYTACEPCEKKPGRPPIWRVKSSRIVWNGEEKTIRFYNPRIEFFGLPIAYLPILEMPDHTVKRKSGFLFPGIGFSSTLGTSVSVPYYWALSPTYDLTTTLRGYTGQGFLGEAEWRQRFNNGQYSIKMAGIYQMNPNRFSAGTVDAQQRLRGMIGTKGEFRINPRWTFGWDILAQTDKNFSYTYNIGDYGNYYHDSQIYLTGLNDRNYFDLRAQRFVVQESTPLPGQQGVQPWVLPGLDYSYTPDRPVAGGELTINVNAQNLYRSQLEASRAALDPAARNFEGVQGASGRFTAEAEWKRELITPGGLVVTPLLQARGDAIYSRLTGATDAAIAAATVGGAPVPSDLRDGYLRYMATAGLEVRWPVLLSSPNSSHVIEPIAQVFARPDAPHQNALGIPNEDAQSLLFDASSLFERDKFSGYDRIEGGVRANLGLRYSGILPGGWSVTAQAGQSFHLAGANPFAAPDLVNAGAFSGLETARSDYVGQVGFSGPRGLGLHGGVRLDETDLTLRRGVVGASARVGPVAVSADYAYIEAQPLYGFANDRHQVTVSGSARVHEFWRVFGSGTYDFRAAQLMRNSIGFAYDDECFSFTFSASQSRNTAGTATNTTFGFNFSLRTIGDIGQSSSGLGFN